MLAKPAPIDTKSAYIDARLGDKPLIELPPLSLYIHIPWCVQKCPYCDFNSHTAGDIPEQQYTDALIADLEQELHLVQGRELQSIFFGGGTPSLFSGQAIGRILAAVEERIPFAADIEITLEANPGTAEQGRFSGYRAAGVNRLSIGVQSFNHQHLKALGRIHTDTEAINAVAMARRAGIDNINLDLMHGLPDQTPAQAHADLQQAIDLGSNHLSWYQLTIEANTPFYYQPPPLPPDDQLADIQDSGMALLSEYGFRQYEISAYCRDDRPARHNLNYWRFGDYIGIGAGAHGKLTLPDQQQIIRRWKTRVPGHYMQRPEPLAGETVLDATDLQIEFLMNSLRLNQGFAIADFQRYTGLDYGVIADPLKQQANRGLLAIDHERVCTTELGQRFLNSLLEAIHSDR